jgi:CubicO group peptidase (beta-lactamase class C family)
LARTSLHGQELTINDLLHHTVGFDENLLNSVTSSIANTTSNIPLKETVLKELSGPMAPSGPLGGPSYANIGWSILGLSLKKLNRFLLDFSW